MTIMRSILRLSSPLGLLRILVLLSLSLALSACGTISTAPDPLSSEHRDDSSMVVVSITSNTAQVSGFDGLLVKQTNVSGNATVKFFALNQIIPDLARDTSVFVGMLHEGEYEFDQFTDSKSKRKLELGTGGRQLLGRFKVTRGKAVDLGRLVLTPANTRVIMGRSIKITSNKPLLAKYAPDYAALLQGETSEGWLGPRTKQDKVEEYALSRPVGLSSPTELNDGSVIAGSRLGSVLVRLPIGKWMIIHSEGLETLHYVKHVKLDNTSMIAVGELGTLLRLPRDGKTLIPIDAGNLPPGNLLFIDGDGEHGWYIAHQRGTSITIYHSIKLEGGDWKPLHQETVGSSFWGGNEKLWVWPTSQGLGYAVSNGNLYQLDYTSGEWQNYKAPKGHDLNSVIPAPDGSLGILSSPSSGLGGIFEDAFLSKDGGATWHEIKAEHKIKLSAPIQLTPNRLLIASLTSAFSGKAVLHVSHDDGASWVKTHGDYRGGEQIIPLSAGRMLAVWPGRDGIFQISFSDDVGARWRLEYSSFDKALYEARQKMK